MIKRSERVTLDGLAMFKEEQLRELKKGRGIPKITLVEEIKDLSITEVIENMISNKIEWRKRIHVTDPN